MEHDFRDVFERYLEDVHVGDRFRHWPGRTISQAAADQFCYWTSNPQPLHLDAEYAAASQHGRVLVNGILVFAIAVGLSVPNLSGNTIANLGFERVDHHAPTFIGDTIYADTEILEVRASASRPDRGIVKARTEARNQRGETVLSYLRTFMLPRRPA